MLFNKSIVTLNTKQFQKVYEFSKNIENNFFSIVFLIFEFDLMKKVKQGFLVRELKTHP